jgi:peptidyl-prolyl cis-trans isomerase SurA
MKISKIFSITIWIAVLVLIFHPGVRAEILNRVVAQVNDDVITLYELDNRIKELTGYDPDELKLKDKKKFIETRRQVLELLVDEKIAFGKIRELGIEITPGEIDEAIERIKESNQLTQEDLIARLKEQDMNLKSYKEEIKRQLERNKLINYEVKSKIVIREEELKDYYAKNKNKFRLIAKVHLATIFLKKEDPSNQEETIALLRKAEDIVFRLKKGEDFGEMAKKFSQGPGAEEGGDLGIFKTSQLDPDLLKVLKDMIPGDVTRPIIRPAGIQIVKLLERQDSIVKPFEEVREAIFEILYKEKVNKRYSSWLKDLREKAYTKIIF